MITPSEALTEVIIPLLVQGKLLLPEDATKYKTKLSSGGMKANDWLLAIEKALEKEPSE